jgi:phosphate transport system permease protein
VGYSQAMNVNIFSGFMGSLPGMMYDQNSAGAGTSPIPSNRLWGAALTLIVLIAVINLVARVVSQVLSPERSGRSPGG